MIPFILLSALFSSGFRQAHFVAIASTVIIISCIWMMYANYQRVDFSAFDLGAALPFLLLYVRSIGIPVALILRFSRVEGIIREVMSRATILAGVYLLLGFAGVIIILIRNL